MKSSHFQALQIRTGLLFEDNDPAWPSSVLGWRGTEVLEFDGLGTMFGFAAEGRATLRVLGPVDLEFSLRPGMYFSLPYAGSIQGGVGFAVCRLRYQGLFSIGGPIEKEGRLKYIDGCTDTLLVPPVIRGDACLNHLHFPIGIQQTRHTHPSLRAGVIAAGSGRCICPSESDGSGEDVEFPLLAGIAFVIPAGGHHSFFTDTETMDVIAYHPDSDTGPIDDDHPMVNRTMIDGVSAARLQEIRTK
ncbi:MAG: hypothetical protein DMF56_15705 [Acidobacteria bacterium]|nr:MAG: hypothetical protein DMF56_15705 [Acidobacteriota bacterium]